MRITLTGAQGQLGTDLQRSLSSHSLTLLDLPGFDLTQADCGEAIMAARPDLVIHAGAYTDVDGAERHQELAMAINRDGTERVARAAARSGARLFYISTDYVFDGSGDRPYNEGDAANPINWYGRSKREGEERALEICPNSLVLRTAWLYGRHGKNFVKTIMQLANERPVLRVVADQRGCPTLAEDLATIIAQLIERPLQGILHVTNAGSCTWHEFAAEIVSLLGLSTKVDPITTAEAGRAAKRPAYSVLACERLHQLGLSLPAWRDALKRFVQRSIPTMACP
jgi:dTDP-4-dehydrorhamnose reductase